MFQRASRTLVVWSVAFLVGLGAQAAFGGSHSWRVSEIFSNADGTVQFIELTECCGLSGETGLNGKTVTSLTNSYGFTANVASPTSNKKILLATNAFAALPGAPARDHAIPANFFNINGDTIKYAPAFNYDTFTFGPAVLPTNGINSIRITNFTTHTFVIEPNSPTNYAGQSGSVNAGGCTDVDGDGYGNPGNGACSGGPQTDCNDNNANVNPGETEVCGDGFDNDCNSATDCQDVACADVIPCVPATSTWGLIVLTLVVLSGGVVFLRSRSRYLFA